MKLTQEGLLENFLDKHVNETSAKSCVPEMTNFGASLPTTSEIDIEKLVAEFDLEVSIPVLTAVPEIYTRYSKPADYEKMVHAGMIAGIRLRLAKLPQSEQAILANNKYYFKDGITHVFKSFAEGSVSLSGATSRFVQYIRECTEKTVK